jgi:hypothetical protein
VLGSQVQRLGRLVTTGNPAPPKSAKP